MIRGSIEGSPDLVSVFLPIVDGSGRFVDAEIRYANRAARASQFDDTPIQALEGARLFEAWPGLRPALFDLCARAVATGQPVSAEIAEDADGDAERHAEVLVFSAEGGLVSVTRDVTERVQAARALRQSEARYADLVAGLPVGVYSAHSYADGRVVFDFMSDRMGEILHVDPRAAERDARAAFARVHPDDLPSLRAGIVEDFAAQRGLHWEGRLVVDDAVRIVRVFSVRVEARDDALLSHGLIEDITEARRVTEDLATSRAALEEAQRIAHVGSWSVDRATGRVAWSDEECRIFGFEPGTPAPSRDEFIALLGRSSSEFLDAVEHADRKPASAGHVLELPLEITLPDGSRRSVIHRAEAMRDASGAIVAIRGTHADVTEQRAMERRLAESARLEAIGRLAGGVAHEFNNMLAGILGTAELMSESIPAGDPLHADLDAIREAGRRAASLSKQLQAFGRQQTLRPVPIHLASYLAGLEPQIRRVAGAGISVEVRRAADIALVYADRAALDDGARARPARLSFDAAGRVVAGGGRHGEGHRWVGPRPGGPPHRVVRRRVGDRFRRCPRRRGAHPHLRAVLLVGRDGAGDGPRPRNHPGDGCAVGRLGGRPTSAQRRHGVLRDASAGTGRRPGARHAHAGRRGGPRADDPLRR
ncbi:MAG: PAS domain-containing protein [Chloroflexota bacterium]